MYVILYIRINDKNRDFESKFAILNTETQQLILKHKLQLKFII